MASDPMPHAAVICINKKRPQNANGDRFVGLPLCPKMLLLLIDILTGTPTNPTPLPAPPSTATAKSIDCHGRLHAAEAAAAASLICV